MKPTSLLALLVVSSFVACTREDARQSSRSSRPSSRPATPAPASPVDASANEPPPPPPPPPGPGSGPAGTPTLTVPSADVPSAALAQLAADTEHPIEVLAGVRLGPIVLGASRESLQGLGLRFQPGPGNVLRSPPYEVTLNAQGRVETASVRLFEARQGLNVNGHLIVRAATVDDIAQELNCGATEQRFGGDFAQCMEGKVVARSPSLAPDGTVVEVRARPLDPGAGRAPDAGTPTGGVRAVRVGNAPPPNCPFLVGDWCFNNPTNACAYAGCAERCQVLEGRPGRVACPGRN